GLQLLDLEGRDRTATAPEDGYVRTSPPAEHVDHVREEFDVPALIGRYGDRVGVLLDGRPDDVLDGSIVSKVHDLRSRRLDQATNDIDCSVMSVEQAGCCHDPQWSVDSRIIPSGTRVHARSQTTHQIFRICLAIVWSCMLVVPS